APAALRLKSMHPSPHPYPARMQLAACASKFHPATGFGAADGGIDQRLHTRAFVKVRFDRRVIRNRRDELARHVILLAKDILVGVVHRVPARARPDRFRNLNRFRLASVPATSDLLHRVPVDVMVKSAFRTMK